MDDYKSIIGEELPILLDKTISYLENGKLDIAEIFLSFIREELPDNEEIANETKNRLDALYTWYNNVSEPYRKIIDSNHYLEKVDAKQELNRIRFTRAYREWKIYKRIISMYKISESNSIVDYEL